MGFAPELVINSWAKLYEILAQTPALPPLRGCLASQSFLDSHGGRSPAGPSIKSVHLCECPGGFIAATNHFIKTKTKGALGHVWRAVSLSPYHEGGNPSELLDDDVLYRHTEDLWLTGYDETGDIVKRRNIEFIWNHTSREPRTRENPTPFGLADLVTADGSFDVQFAPHLQEELTAPLVFAEVVCMLGLLNIKGTGIVKMYGLLSHQSISILAILSMCFNHVVLAKPSMSRPGNSELYAVCLEFVGIRSSFLSVLSRLVDSAHDVLGKQGKTLIPKHWIPEEFLQECVEAARFFASHQIQQIDRNLSPINFQDRIVKDVHFMTDWARNPFTNSTRRATRRRVQGTLQDRQRCHDLFEALHAARQLQWETAARLIDEEDGRGARGRAAAGRRIPFVKPEAAVRAVCAFVEAQRKQAEDGSGQSSALAVKETESLAQYLELLPRSGGRIDHEDHESPEAYDPTGPGGAPSKRLPFWLNLFGLHMKPRRTAASRQPASHSGGGAGAPGDLLSFFAGISGQSHAAEEDASADAAGAGNHLEEEQDEKEREEEKEQRERWTKELGEGLQRKDYLRPKSRWITPALAIRPFAVRLSRFADDQLMALLMEKRTRLPFVLPYLPSDYLVSEGDRSSSFAAAAPVSLPSSFTVDLALALLCLCPASPVASRSPDSTPREGAPGRGLQKLQAWRDSLARRYPSGYLELSSQGTEGCTDGEAGEARAEGEPPERGVLPDLVRRAQIPLSGAVLVNGVSACEEDERNALGDGCGVSRLPPFFDIPDWEDEQARRQRESEANAKTREREGPGRLDLLNEFERGTKSAELIQKFTSRCLTVRGGGDGRRPCAAGLVYADITGLERTDCQRAPQTQISFPVSPAVSASSPASFSFEWREEDVADQAFAELAEAEMRSGVLLVGQLLEVGKSSSSDSSTFGYLYLSALTVLESNGDFILRMHSAYMRFTASIVLLLAGAFSNAAFFAPASLAVWRNQRFFLGYALRPIEAAETKKILGTVWDRLVDTRAKTKREEEGRKTLEGPAGGNSREKNQDESIWTISQCLPAKLFTGLVPSTWLCRWNDFFLRAQIRDVDRRLALLAAARRRLLDAGDCSSAKLASSERASAGVCATSAEAERMHKKPRYGGEAPCMQETCWNAATADTETKAAEQRGGSPAGVSTEEDVAGALLLQPRSKREKVVARFLERLGVADFLLPEASPFRQCRSGSGASKKKAGRKAEDRSDEGKKKEDKSEEDKDGDGAREEEKAKPSAVPWESLLTEAAQSSDRVWGNVKFLSLQAICRAAVGDGVQRDNEEVFWRGSV
ncbi:putative ftsJ-like methyltransferase domain-containing protein [Neospora caninum Liverpool]|uniref:Cap-specific mRNA (nucleoside-2'-O-)-methyltransferase 2 n=1 Tax=Neospora caninum (strain Liverpool) TaxID=572307 RepID=F0VRH7_NEOCL|nr:putative ftsJ-like methyltransferase domain-containing protein [Neospora caninum Liverpool]CBZ56325.1 putative ftsJ-like methyltransferase domain-containing protein [Neospora caninum Liverpool]|eukprot:XP_003886350.1 putative ftsJ-like methyltransferase domain-containing protein [Neospora caninum Liverpool]